MIQVETERLKTRNADFLKIIFEDASKLNLTKDLKTALASKDKTPSEEYLINKFIQRNKTILDDIKYDEYKLSASKDEIELIMDNFYEKFTPKK